MYDWFIFIRYHFGEISIATFPRYPATPEPAFSWRRKSETNWELQKKTIPWIRGFFGDKKNKFLCFDTILETSFSASFIRIKYILCIQCIHTMLWYYQQYMRGDKETNLLRIKYRTFSLTLFCSILYIWKFIPSRILIQKWTLRINREKNIWMQGNSLNGSI